MIEANERLVYEQSQAHYRELIRQAEQERLVRRAALNSGPVRLPRTNWLRALVAYVRAFRADGAGVGTTLN